MTKIVYITGFGEFSGVKENPTTEIVEELQKCNFGVAHAMCKFQVLEVSVEFCRSFVSDLSFDNNEYIFIHLGVDSKAESLRLEQCAYNNMSFRVPDEKGYQPEQLLIHEQAELDTPLHSAILLPEICNTVNTTNIAIANSEIPLVTLSTDPGRFLCNFIYYNTLTQLQKNNKPLHSLFVHVPTFETILKEHQVATVKNLVEAIVASIEAKQL